MLNIEPILNNLTENFNQSVEDEVKKRIIKTKTPKNKYYDFMNMSQRYIDVHSLFDDLIEFEYLNSFDISDDFENLQNHELSDDDIKHKQLFYFLIKLDDEKFNELKSKIDTWFKLKNQFFGIQHKINDEYFQLSDSYCDSNCDLTFEDQNPMIDRWFEEFGFKSDVEDWRV